MIRELCTWRHRLRLDLRTLVHQFIKWAYVRQLKKITWATVSDHIRVLDSCLRSRRLGVRLEATREGGGECRVLRGRAEEKRKIELSSV